MAGVLHEPGSQFGPCNHKCHHNSCAGWRRMAEAVCGLCHQPIGYGRRYLRDYRVGSDPRVPNLVHKVCADAEDQLPQERLVSAASMFASHARGE